MKPNSLRLKINVAILLVYLLVVVFFGTIFLRSESNRRFSKFKSIELLISAVFQQNREKLANEIFGVYQEALKVTVQEMLKVEGIADIDVFDAVGKLLYSTSSANTEDLPLNELEDLKKDPSFVEKAKRGSLFAIYSTPIKVVGEQYGILRLYYDMTELEREYLIDKIIFITRLSVTFLVLFGILDFLLFRTVIRPALLLRDAIHKVQEGNLGEQVNINSGDEIGEIAKDFNEMSTQLYQQRIELLESRERMQLVMDYIPQFIYWQNKEHTYLGCNKNFARVAGLKNTDDIRGKTYSDLPLEKHIVDYFQSASEQAMLKNKPQLHIVKEFLLRGEKDGHLLINFIPLHSAKREVVGILCTYENITDKMRDKAEKEKLEVQLMHASRLTAMGEMASGIAHEINQPLTIINVVADGLMNRLLEKDDDDILVNSTQRIIDQVLRASNIIDNMRSFVRVGSAAEPEPIDIKKPINLALTFFTEQFRIHGIELILDLEAEVPHIRVDSQKFEQILINLLTNARFAVDSKMKEYGKKFKKRVTVSLSYDKSRNKALFEVSDNGVGMDKETLEHCFEPFFTTRDVGEGTGLGLSIVHSIIREFKMDIEIDSVEGEGCTFKVTMDC